MNLSNVKNWKFNNREQVRALTDEQLIETTKDVREAIRLFKNADIPITTEMFWLFIATNDIMRERNLE